MVESSCKLNMLFLLLTLFDFRVILARLRKNILNLKYVRTKSTDFSIVVPIFGNVSYLQNLEFLRKHKKHVVLCSIYNTKDPAFIPSLHALAKAEDFRILYGYKSPNFSKPALLNVAIRRLKEKYIIFLDGDTFIQGSPERLCGALEKWNLDLASVRILPSSRSNILERLQNIEYDISMDVRLIDHWLTSGAGMVGKRKVLLGVMRNHSLFFHGDDIEIGKIADMMGYRVGHIPMIFRTIVPSKFSSWTRQRISWSVGIFRHGIINFEKGMKYPFEFMYVSIIMFILLPFKIYEVIHLWILLPFFFFLYIILIYIFHWHLRSRYMLLYPFYALFQSWILLIVGMFTFVFVLSKGKKFGRIEIHHNPKGVSVSHWNYLRMHAGSYVFAVIALGILMIGSSSLAQNLVFGRSYNLIQIIDFFISTISAIFRSFN